MKILIVGDNLESYLAKCHEALRTGLRRSFDARCFGVGYDVYDPGIGSYPEIMARVFPEDLPDLLIISFNSEEDQLACNYRHRGIDEVNVPVAAILGDYWRLAENHHRSFAEMVARSRMDILLSLFPQPLEIWKGTAIADRLVYMPPCFDPSIFNDWNMPKLYDVGFLAANTLKYSEFYPERYGIHQKLVSRRDINYLWAEHPGWKRHADDHPLVGKNFSRALNSCKIFITTGGRYRNAQPKIFEALASRTLLMADNPIGAEELGLRDGVNYVQVTVDDVCEKIDYYLERPERMSEIADAGYRLAIKHHSCYARACDFLDKVSPRLRQSNRGGFFPNKSCALADAERNYPDRHVARLQIPLTLLMDDNHAESLRLSEGLTSLPISSAPQYTLYRLLRHLRPKRVLEIGTQSGASAVAMALAFSDNQFDIDITCVDPFFPCGDNNGTLTLEQWHTNVEASGFGYGINLLMSTSAEILPRLDKKFDFVFVDGSHKYENVLDDCVLAVHLLTPGGYFLVHDYVFYDSVRRACDEVIAEFGLPFHVNPLQKNPRQEICGWIIARKDRDFDLDSRLSDIRLRVENNNSAPPKRGIFMSIMKFLKGLILCN